VSSSRPGQSFVRIEVRPRTVEEAERAVAEGWAAGAIGVEERESDGGISLILYARADSAQRVEGALHERLGDACDIGAPEAVPEQDWSHSWRQGFEATPVSARLLVRPSFASTRPQSGQQELVIDPGQAFGTGSHASTRLALEWVDALAPELGPGAEVLDVGTGSGILALAALRLSPVRAVALDLDPLAAAAAAHNAAVNGLAERLRIFTGSLDALGPGGFTLVLANLLRTELLPLIAALAAHTAPGGRAVISGLLAEEREAAGAALASAGLAPVDVREREDESGERWCALLTKR
jgi:ribosomal protein L11 methyltransferase